jgi:hypothetical protein
MAAHLLQISPGRRAEKNLEPSRFSLNRGQALAFCFVVLLIGKPVPTFPEAL